MFGDLYFLVRDFWATDLERQMDDLFWLLGNTLFSKIDPWCILINYFEKQFNNNVYSAILLFKWTLLAL